MSETKQTPPPSGDAGKTATAGEGVPGMPCTGTSSSRERKARADSAARLLDAFAEYEHTVSLLLAAVLRLCLPAGDREPDDAEAPHANCADRRKFPNG